MRRALNARNSLILQLADEVRAKAAALIPVHDVSFAINESHSAIIPEIGVGGSCYASGLVSIDVSQTVEMSTPALDQVLRYTIAHELHHAARWRSVGCGRSLGEAWVFEGLADHFAQQLTPGVVMPWTRQMTYFSRRVCHAYLPFALRLNRYDRHIWFSRGSILKGIPRWAGYSLGFELVGRHLSLSGNAASDCHATSAADVLQRPNNFAAAE
jgi:uncharacterized protein YjaZ